MIAHCIEDIPINQHKIVSKYVGDCQADILAAIAETQANDPQLSIITYLGLSTEKVMCRGYICFTAEVHWRIKG